MTTYKLKLSFCDDFHESSKKAKTLAANKKTIVEFKFNSVKCLVNKDTNLAWLFRDYLNSWTMNWKVVGPNCLSVYNKKTQEIFDKRTKEAAEKAAIEDAAYRKKEDREKLALEKNIAGIELELSDPVKWQKSREANTDDYGKCALDYAEGWAKLMQIEIAKGKSVKECANPTQKGVSFYGITGAMYGCAISILSQTWKHGEELRKWHNKEWGVSEDKAGVVNPAVLNIG